MFEHTKNLSNILCQLCVNKNAFHSGLSKQKIQLICFSNKYFQNASDFIITVKTLEIIGSYDEISDKNWFH